jgi:transposase
MRLATVFKRVLRLARERVVDVEIRGEKDAEEIVVTIARDRRAKMRCPGCGYATRATYDRGVRSWRHLDCLRTRCLIRCEVRRIQCPTCGVVTEEVPWARAGAGFTRGFEDTCAWLAKAAPKSVVATLMRIDWDTVGRMIERVVDEARGGAGADWLDGLTRIGVDEVAWRKGHRYLMVVTCHTTGRIVWTHPGRSKETLERFFAELGPERARRLEAVSVDLVAGWPEVIERLAPQATICADPFHVVALAGKALDALRRQDWQRLRKEDPERAKWLTLTSAVCRQKQPSAGAFVLVMGLRGCSGAAKV